MNNLSRMRRVSAREKKKIPSRTEQQKTVARKFLPEKSRFFKSGKTLNGHNSIIFKYYEKEKYRF